MSREPFEEIEHTADRAFRVSGRDLSELFTNAARVISMLQGTGADTQPGITREVQLSAGDRETLLVDWLNELLYLQELHGEHHSQFQILEVSDTQLSARIHGAPESAPRRIVKAVTFHGLEVKRLADDWEATIVLDV